MGVSGCGKSTVAKAIADKLCYQFVEADDFHSIENREHMAQGKPLNNKMREPWIIALCDYLQYGAQQKVDCVMAFSGLQAEHRARFNQLGFERITLFLDGKPELIQQRIENRTNHYMPSSLLKSQYQSLQNPECEANTFKVNIDNDLSSIIQQSLKLIETII